MDIHVSIPFKRESVFKAFFTDKVSRDEHYCFNSLQTGKCIQSDRVQAVPSDEERFQFPSNGKVYSKTAFETPRPFERSTVSIPFKRESVFKVTAIAKEMQDSGVSIPFKRESVFKDGHRLEEWVVTGGFNSLQTGKCIQRIKVPL